MTIQKNNTLKNLPDLGVTVSPRMIKNPKVSSGALRLWLFMRQMPEDWRPTIGGFATLLRRLGFKASYDTVSRWCRELKATGYLTITKLRDAPGRWTGWAWATYPVPREEYVSMRAEWEVGIYNPAKMPDR